MKFPHAVRGNIIFCLVVVATIVVVRYANPAPQGGEELENIDGITQQAIGLFNDINKFITSIAFIIVGFLGNVMIGKTSLQHRESFFSLVLFFGSLLLAIVSIFYSFLSYSKLFELVAERIIDVKNKQLQYAQSRQFWTLFASVFLFTWYLFNSYWISKTRDK